MTEANVSTILGDPPEARHRCWRERRLKELSAPDSWLGLVGLYWLEPGRNAVGRAEDCSVALPGGPARLGSLLWEDSFILWQPAPGARAEVEGGREGADGAVILRTDRDGEPSRVRYGDFDFFVIERGGRPAVRLRDLAWPGKRTFTGVDCYPFDAAWRIEAIWEELPEPWALEIQSVTGESKTIDVPARAIFEADGTEHALLPLEIGEDNVLFIFRDATSGRETYGGGRFLKAGRPTDGHIILDFNRAFNPPCAFTAFATCSLAPPENRLPLPIRAGEKKYAGAY